MTPLIRANKTPKLLYAVYLLTNSWQCTALRIHTCVWWNKKLVHITRHCDIQIGMYRMLRLIIGLYLQTLRICLAKWYLNRDDLRLTIRMHKLIWIYTIPKSQPIPLPIDGLMFVDNTPCVGDSVSNKEFIVWVRSRVRSPRGRRQNVGLPLSHSLRVLVV